MEVRIEGPVLKISLPARWVRFVAQSISFLLMLLVLSVSILEAQVRVRGYYRKDGTYVRPHVRTAPDGSPYNNYSFPGNYNPNTGLITPGNPATYLRNYYGRGGSAGIPGSSGRVGTVPSVAARREGVAALQYSLHVLGYDAGPVDGIPGPRTANALRAFQRSSSLQPSGIVTEETLDALIGALVTARASLTATTSSSSMTGQAAISAPSARYPASVPTNATMGYGGTGWRCNRGYYRTNNECLPVQVPANASVNYSGDGWMCNRGYYRSGMGCAAVQIPPNATLNYSGDGWMCTRGFYRSGNGCVRVEIPANATLNYSGDGWMCVRGFFRSGNQCIAVTIPANAQLNYSGDGWMCVRGYYRRGSECAPVQVPANARLNYSGDGWMCNEGYVRSGDRCIPR
jgi:peptidoglycan hydrolase-like protein with peptidoglycan-binding domain